MPIRKGMLCIALLLLIALLTPGCAAAPGASGASPAATLPRHARLSPGDARELIRNWLAANRPEFNLDALADLRETDFGIPNLFEDTGAQYYALNSYVYILHDGAVCEVYRLEPQSAILADADGDGAAEAVFVGDVGSGLYIRVVTVVKGGTAYRLNLKDSAANAGYRLVRAADASATLLRLTYDENARVKEECAAGTVRLADGEIALVK